MRRNLTIVVMLIALFSMFSATALFAQASATSDTTVSAAPAADTTVAPAQAAAPASASTSNGLETLARKIVGSGFVDYFLAGGWAMWPILFLAIMGLAYIIWKLIALNYAKINVVRFIDKVVPLIQQKKVKEAVEFCQKERGPVAAIIYAGLLKADKGISAVEKSIENAGVIEMSYLEKGMIALTTVITLGPMLGFLGTVVGMVAAFDAIAKAGEVEPTIVADGIKIALITTVGGLVVAIPVQFFYNIFTTQIDGLVIDMQRASEKVMEAYIESQGE